ISCRVNRPNGHESNNACRDREKSSSIAGSSVSHRSPCERKQGGEEECKVPDNLEREDDWRRGRRYPAVWYRGTGSKQRREERLYADPKLVCRRLDSWDVSRVNNLSEAEEGDDDGR